MKSRYLTIAAAAAIAVSLAACSSSSSSSARPASGTETLTGQLAGKAAIAHTPTYHLTFTGPVDTTGTFTPPDSNASHQVATFRTAAGVMVASAVVTGQNAPAVSLGGCRYEFVIHAAYTVNGAKSTGKFKGATGHGNVTVTSRASVPKTKRGACENINSNSTQPVAAGATSAFAGGGPLTVKP